MVDVADRRSPVFQAMARNALDFTIKGKSAEAGAVLQRMSARYGGNGAVEAALLWIDTLADHLGRPSDGTGVAILFKEAETGNVGIADQRRPTVVWAGRLIGARLADDQDTFVALINAVGGRADFGAYVGELLHMVALTFQHGQVLHHRSPDSHVRCRSILKDRMTELGVDVTVTTAWPGVSPYDQPPMTCPHGIQYWLEPTAEQVAAWERDGIE